MKQYICGNYPDVAKFLASFPTLHEWDWSCWGPDFIFDKGPDGLRERYRIMCSGGQHAVNLALEIWSRRIEWKRYGFEKFCLPAALGTWDLAHKKAFLAYVENPFFP